MKRICIIIILLSTLMPSALSADAQEKAPCKETKIIEAFLDSLPGIFCDNLNYNDLFSESSIAAKVFADENGNVKKIKIGKCSTPPSGNCDSHSTKTAKKLLIESSKSIIEKQKWEEGKNICKIIWKPRHSPHSKKEQNISHTLSAIISESVTTETKKEITGVDGSAYISIATNASGRIQSTEYIGSIYWETNDTGHKTAHITGMKVAYFSNEGNGYSSVHTPYSREEDIKERKRRKIFKNCANSVSEKLIGKQLSEIISQRNKEKNIIIGININATSIDIEQTDPLFPGGTKEIKRLILNAVKSNKIVKESDVKGIIEIELFIAENGEAKVNDIVTKIHKTSPTINHSKEKIKETIYKEVKKAIKQMPRWTPGTYDGKAQEVLCSFKIKLE